MFLSALCVCLCVLSLSVRVCLCASTQHAFPGSSPWQLVCQFFGLLLSNFQTPPNQQPRKETLPVLDVNNPLYQSQRLQSPTPALSLCQPYYIVLIDIVGTGQPALGQLWCRGPQVTHHCSFADFKTRSEV